MAVMFAATFFASVAKLEANEQVKAIDFVNRFQANPANPGMSLERLRTRSKNIWSGRITRDLRAILFQDGEHWALLYADHHDPAYRWAERRSVGRHPVTGVLQVVETVESVQETQGLAGTAAAAASPTFGDHDDAYLSSLGVPEDWLPTIRRVASEDELLAVVEKLPEDVGERLMDLAAGEFVTPPAPVKPDSSPAEHPDARRRFFVTDDLDELRHALEAPLRTWIAFLHPSQRDLAEGTFAGPVKVTGSAGTGKTVVAMHRARHLARLGHKVLLTSFVRTLCHNVQQNLALFCTPAELGRITVSTVHSEALAVVRRIERDAQPATDEEVGRLLDEMTSRHGTRFEPGFVRDEWEHVIDAQGIRSWAEYRSARRTGRGRALTMQDRKALWRVFGDVQSSLADRSKYDWPGMCRRAQELLEAGEVDSPYTGVVVDELQDLEPPALRFLAALAAKHPENFMLVGDAGQSLYVGGFALADLGIDVAGRTHTLRLNYRTTEQIRRSADTILGPVDHDRDGGAETRQQTRSLLRGPVPVLRGFPDDDAEAEAAVRQIETWLSDGLAPEAIAVFGRTRKLADQIAQRLQTASLAVQRLSDDKSSPDGCVNVGTMHRAKGLEFKAVLLVGCNDWQLPNRGVIRSATDPQDRDEAIERERRLLYVAMTRARDELVVTWRGKPSPFLAPMLEPTP